MKLITVTYTHKGWIGLCPVYIGEPDSEKPNIDSRDLIPYWWLHLNLWLFELAGFALEALDPTYKFQWPIAITGKLEKPVTQKAYLSDYRKHNEDTQLSRVIP